MPINNYDRTDLAELDQKTIKDYIKKTMDFLDETIPRHEKLSHGNICLNVLIGALFSIIFPFLREKAEQEEFLQNLLHQMRNNFEANSKLNQ